jgi:hypothetical protein
VPILDPEETLSGAFSAICDNKCEDVYWLDIDRLSQQQIEKLKAVLLKMHGGPSTTWDEQLARDRRLFLPVRKNQCIGFFSIKAARVEVIVKALEVIK